MTDEAIDSQLIGALRIGGDMREDVGGPRRSGGSRATLWILLALLVLALAAAGGAWWWFTMRPIVVQTAVATAAGRAPVDAPVLQATGYVTARRLATVSTQVTGTLIEVLIEEGMVVRKGQVLARLDDAGYRATLRVAQANILSAQAQIVQAKAQLAQAEADARRLDSLGQTGMVSKQAAEQARTSAATASAQLEARMREADSARAQLAQAQVNLDYTVVHAPFSGVVTVKAAQVGEIVSPLSAGGGFTRTGVGTIVDMDSLEIDVDVSEANIGQVRAGMPAEAVLDAYRTWKVPAHVIAIVPTADRGKATIKVRVALDQKDARIVPDMGARVSFLEASAPASTNAAARGVAVPSSAMTTRRGENVVFVVRDRVAREKKLGAITRAGDLVVSQSSEIAPGDSIVVAPPESLADGQSVESGEPPR